MVYFFDVEIAVLVFLEFDPEFIELLNDIKATRRVFVDRRLIAYAVIRNRNFLGILLRRRISGHNRVVQPVHAHGNGARTLHVGFLEKDHTRLGITPLRLVGGHRTGSAATDHQHVAFDFGQAVLNFVHHSSFTQRGAPTTRGDIPTDRFRGRVRPRKTAALRNFRSAQQQRPASRVED